MGNSKLYEIGKRNTNIFTKEDDNVAHYCSLQDLVEVSREQFWNPDSLTDNRWGGVLKRGSNDQPESQSVTESEILTKPQKDMKSKISKNNTFHLSWWPMRTNE